ncbi:MAG: response regulator [Candidatus Muirbacterium halophilum]|nr:response regulator [Candidatus Muirbacterium halophilum]MCK9475190.1 response regulator [Candidatus Muirbacterium halophilum]
MKIYILDDKDYYVTILKERLEKKGYSVIANTDPYVGEKELCDIKDIDLLILDYNMPILNGLEILRRLDKKSNYKLPEVFIMANDIPEEHMIELKKYSSNIIFKPFILSELEENIEYVFGREIIEGELKKPENSEISTFRKIIEDMRKRIDELEKQIRNKNIRLDEKDRKILQLEENQKLFIEKIKTSEQNYDELNSFKKNMSEKDHNIEELQIKLENMQKNFKDDISKKNNELQKKNNYYRAYIYFLKGNSKKANEINNNILKKYPDYTKAIKLAKKLLT